MIKNEKTIRFLEEHIPELADAVLKLAYWKTLAFGLPVLVCRDGSLVRVHPDGTEEFVKKLPPSTPVTPGQILEIP